MSRTFQPDSRVRVIRDASFGSAGDRIGQVGRIFFPIKTWTQFDWAVEFGDEKNYGEIKHFNEIDLELFIAQSEKVADILTPEERKLFQKGVEAIGTVGIFGQNISEQYFEAFRLLRETGRDIYR